MKILKELREDMNNNEDSFREKLENIRRSQDKLENSFAEIQTELKAIKTRMNNAEKQLVRWKIEKWKSPNQDSRQETK